MQANTDSFGNTNQLLLPHECLANGRQDSVFKSLGVKQEIRHSRVAKLTAWHVGAQDLACKEVIGRLTLGS